MNGSKTVLITGASGNLGGKLRQHLQERYTLRLLDIHPHGDREIVQADLSVWNKEWGRLFQKVDIVVHLAANPIDFQNWDTLTGPNIDAMVNVFSASVQAGVKRVVFASSNHVMGGYKDVLRPEKLTTGIPVKPGMHYVVDGSQRDSTPYGSAKLFGERLGKCYADIYGLSVIAVRIGWVLPGNNSTKDVPAGFNGWFRLMWLSNRDFCQLMERCIEADDSVRFAVINGMSANKGMRWDIEHTRDTVGFSPLDDVTQGKG